MSPLLLLCVCLLGPTLGLAHPLHFRILTVEDLVKQIVDNQTTIQVSTTKNCTEIARMRLNLPDSEKLAKVLPDFMDPATRENGGFLVHLSLFFYACLLLAVIIDSYFVPSLEFFSSVLRISPNIAASTFMAFGTSAPEFFTSMYSCIVAESSIGTGVIVGSSVVNTLAIPGICGLAVLFVGQPNQLPNTSRYAIIRDLLFFTITVLVFILAIKDNSVGSLESLIFLFMYILYIFVLYIWSHLKVNNGKEMPIVKRAKMGGHLRSSSSSPSSRRSSTESSSSLLPKYLLEDLSCIRIPLLPFLALVRVTVPKPCKAYFIVSFLMSCLWIAGLTYFNLWMVASIAATFHLPDAVAGMTLLALGTNLPELIMSFILVSKYRLPDMAICHTIGSNIFDILICLGLPWFIQILALTVRDGAELSQLGGQVIPLEGSQLSFVCLALLLSILALSAILYFTHCQLSLTAGILCITAYGAFIGTVLVMQIYSLL